MEIPRRVVWTDKEKSSTDEDCPSTRAAKEDKHIKETQPLGDAKKKMRDAMDKTRESLQRSKEREEKEKKAKRKEKKEKQILHVH